MTVDWQPTLRGALVELRPLRADDWSALYAVASDPLIWEQHPARDRYEEPVFREFFRIALESASAFVVLDRETGAVIGSTRYHDYNPITREVEIGWTFLARSHWGGRFNGEMKQLMLQHAFQFVDRVIFVIGPTNIRSQRAVQQIGGVFLETRVIRGQESVVYAIASDYGHG
jgi:RimJ/RimL family protein N-acetyltransferase